MADRAVAQLEDEPLRQPLDSNTNSIAVIMKHVAGNLRSRWTDLLTTDGEKPWRDRDQEFVDTFGNRDELLDHWNNGWNRLFDTLQSLSDDDLRGSVMIRGEQHTVPQAISRSLAHSVYHVGQVVLIARVLAKDKWRTLTIPPRQSAAHNEASWGTTQYMGRVDESTEENP